ncbi:MAG: DivIVA domain-containing protein [Actinobacteria bacterium]|nr:DivIVA domain-containing protein [Actinomycetota bacterium]
MSPAELDLPLLPSAEQIRRREFATIRRGYDPDQVRDYLLQIAVQVETLERALRSSNLEAGATEPVVHVPEPVAAEDPYDRLASRVADVLRAADDRAERIVHDARDEAARTIAEARSEADRIRVDAQSRAEEARNDAGDLLRDAKAEADRVLSALSARRETLVTQLAEMQSRLLGVARELEAAIDEPAMGPAIGEPEMDLTQGASEEGLPASRADTPPGAAQDLGEPEAGEFLEALTSDPIDPRYEDMWVSRETVSLDLGDLGLGDEEDDEGDPAPA